MARDRERGFNPDLRVGSARVSLDREPKRPEALADLGGAWEIRRESDACSQLPSLVQTAGGGALADHPVIEQLEGAAELITDLLGDHLGGEGGSRGRGGEGERPVGG